MISNATCPSCWEPSLDGLLCRKCTWRLRVSLTEIPILMGEFTTSYTRQGRAGTNAGRMKTDQYVGPLPFDGYASDARDVAIATIGTWIREISVGDFYIRVNQEVVNLQKGGPHTIIREEHHPVPATMSAWCSWLLDRITRIRGREDVADIKDEIVHCHQFIRSAVDIASQHVFAGACEICGKGDLYGIDGGKTATCKACGALVDDFPMRRARLVVQAEDAKVDKATILKALPEVYGVAISDTRFRKWISRGTLTRAVVLEKSWDADGKRIIPQRYRVGDVLDLIKGIATRRAGDLRKTG